MREGIIIEGVDKGKRRAGVLEENEGWNEGKLRELRREDREDDRGK